MSKDKDVQGCRRLQMRKSKGNTENLPDCSAKKKLCKRDLHNYVVSMNVSYKVSAHLILSHFRSLESEPPMSYV